MEMRKLQVVGRTSFSITLPPNWIKDNKLRRGDQITLTQEEDGSVRLIPGVVPERGKCIIKIDADRCKRPGLLQRLIVGGYIRGCDLIEVTSKHRIKRDQKEEIQATINSLLGLGIMEVASDHVMIHSLIDHSKTPIMPLLKRLCQLACSMHKDAIQALKNRDLSLAEDITYRENEVNKIYWLTIRQLVATTHDKSLLHKLGLEGTRDPADYRAVAVKSESRADCAEDIAKNVLALGKKKIDDAKLQKIIQLGELAYEASHSACEAFFKGDMLLANSAVEVVDSFEERVEELIKEMHIRTEEIYVCPYLMAIIRDLCIIAECGKRIAEVTINDFVFEKTRLP